MKKGFEYQYFLKDHLGNTRVVLSQTGKSLQQNSYYPFGMLMAGLPEPEENHDNKYLYNGKELQDDFGLDWYDYGKRFYDAQLGRWHVVDPVAEDHLDNTPYNYAFNNPLLYIDPLGMDTVNVNSDTPVKKDDVVVLDDGSFITASVDEVVVTPEEKSNDDGIKEAENNESSKIKNNENKINKIDSKILAIEKRRDDDIEFGEAYMHTSLDASADGAKAFSIGYVIAGKSLLNKAYKRSDSIKNLKHKKDSLVKVNIKLKKVNNK